MKSAAWWPSWALLLKRSSRPATGIGPGWRKSSGCQTMIFFEELGRYSHFAFRAFLAALRAVFKPGLVYTQLHQVLLGALPLGIAAGLTVGAVVWMHLRTTVEVLAGREAVPQLPRFLALAVALELAPIIAGLMAAGRTGASLRAGLGSVRLNGTIDALGVLGPSTI